MFKFTPDQQMALDFPGNVIVSAGAGSGKTRVLVEKYFRLLVDEHPDWPVDSVVAITFTRKAAAELKSRIIKRVLDELAIELEHGPRRQRLRQLRCDVGAAPIGTIHNFCGRILKEFSFDAHLNPDFMIVEGAQEGALRMKAAHETIALATADKGGELYTDLLGLLNVMSAIKLKGILTGMLAGRTAYINPAQEYVGHSLDELFEKLKKFHGEYVKDLRREMGREWLALLRQLDHLSQAGNVKEIVGAAVEGWPSDAVGEWFACEELLQNVYSLLTKTGTCRKADFKKAGFEEHDPIRSAFEELAGRCQKARLGELGELDRDDLELSRRLARLFLKAVEIYEQLRGGDEDDAEAALVDYADLELMAEKLVAENVQVRRQIRERYRFLIIDEFQDTSGPQWNIMRPLVTDEHGKPLTACLFVVGDRKQGVYGFREANVTLFAQVQELVTASNEAWMGCDGKVSMAANFRTSNTPLEFINRVFEKLLTGGKDNNYSVDFEPLKVMRQEPEGCVEFLLTGSAEPEVNDDTGKPVARSAEEKLDDEAKLVAAHVAQVIEKGEAKPGEVALLFRKRSVFTAYENALRERGIPVVTQQGINLFKQPELADMVAALKAVVYPHRDLVLVHYLRSPFVGFSDDLLLKIARSPGRSFWDKATRVHTEKSYRLDQDWYPVTDQEHERLTFALGTLNDARSMVGMMSPYKVVRSIMDTLGARTIVQVRYRGEQAVANLDKLLAVARSAEFLSFEEFLEYVESEGQSDRGMSEAADLTSPDAVKIMTVHAAKGLEFPVVYLPGLNSGTSAKPKTINGDGERWLTMRLPREQMPESSFLMDYFKTRDELQGAAEERRVFYVAMTRCEHRLILSADCDKARVKNTFYSWIEDEFERGRNAGHLKTEEDFPEQESQKTSEPASINSQISREARIEAALRAAKHFPGAQPVSQVERNFFDTRRPELIYEILPDFLALLGSSTNEQAVQEICRSIIPLNDEAQMGKLERQLGQVAEWVRVTFGDGKITFFSKVRLNLPARVQVFTPHVLSGNKCGWVVANGPEGELVRMEVERYRACSMEAPGAPVVAVFELDEIAEAGAAHN